MRRGVASLSGSSAVTFTNLHALWSSAHRWFGESFLLSGNALAYWKGRDSGCEWEVGEMCAEAYKSISMELLKAPLPNDAKQYLQMNVFNKIRSDYGRKAILLSLIFWQKHVIVSWMTYLNLAWILVIRHFSLLGFVLGFLFGGLGDASKFWLPLFNRQPSRCGQNWGGGARIGTRSRDKCACLEYY